VTRSIKHALIREKESGTLTKDVETFLAILSRRVEMISTSLLNIEQEIPENLDSVQKAVDSHLSSTGSTAFFSTAPSRKSSSSSKDKDPDSSYPDLLPSKALRAWILENLADPFPPRQDKEKLVKKTNLEEQGKATLAYNQVREKIELSF